MTSLVCIAWRIAQILHPGSVKMSRDSQYRGITLQNTWNFTVTVQLRKILLLVPPFVSLTMHNSSIMKDINYILYQSLWTMNQLGSYIRTTTFNYILIKYLVIHFFMCKQSIHAVNFQSQVVHFSNPFWNWIAFCITIDSLG